jgi:hypothetical protein
MTNPQPAPALLSAFKRAQERNRELEAFIRWEDALFSNPHLSGNHKLEIRATRRAVQRAQTHDEQGRARINLTTIAEQIGISPDTMGRGLKVLKQCGIIADHNLKPEIQENGERWTRHYVTLNEDLLKRPKEIQPPAPRNHGGSRYHCQQCGSDKVKIRTARTIVCTCCNHETELDTTERDQEAQTSVDQAQPKNVDELGGNLQDTLKPVSPPYAANCDGPRGPGKDQANDTSDQDDRAAAAALLLALAGQADEHIEMSRRGEKKYYTVDRPLTLNDLIDHLQGGKARGASCRRPDGQTRSLCWDADDPERWELLQQAARQLAQAGYVPILEPSPGDRGGHLWTIYDDLVDASAARQHVYSLAPELADLVEYWPGPQAAKRWNRVRLPGAKYVRPGVSAWCQLVSVATGETSQDGRSAATLLLASQTPASIVPAIMASQTDQDDQAQAYCVAQQLEPEPPALPNSDLADKSNLQPGQVDTQWCERYNTPEGKRLWFAWTPAQLAAWWNERHTIDELLPGGRNGYGLASWRGERTPSVARRGEQWTDFGASARRADGNPDTGDALELHVRLTGAPKPEVMRAAAQELLQEARQALENAASNGEPLPAWVVEIITPAGREHYARVASQSGYIDQAAAAQEERHEHALRNDDQAQASTLERQALVAPAISDQDSEQGGPPGFSPRNPASAVPSSNPMQTMAMLEVIKDYGRAREWEALVIDGEEIIPAGRSNWLHFVWLSQQQDQQRHVYEYIRDRS